MCHNCFYRKNIKLFLETRAQLGVFSFENHKRKRSRTATLMEFGAQAAENFLWKTIEDKLADEHGLAIVVVEGKDSVVVSKSNNNSICEHLYPSAEFAPRCDRYCGKAFERATEAGKTVHAKCHADLNLLAVPIATKEKTLVAIVGRSFLKSEDYRKATERAISGDWQQFPPADLFANVLISGSFGELETLARRIEKLSAEEKEALLEFEKSVAKLPEDVEGAGEIAEPSSSAVAANEIVPQETPDTASSSSADAEARARPDETFFESSLERETAAGEIVERNAEEIAELGAWRSLLGSLLNLTYKEACGAVLKFLGRRYKLLSLGWLERKENSLDIVLASGALKNQQMQISIAADDERLLETARTDTSLEFRERRTGDGGEETNPQIIQLFPVVVGEQVRAAVIVGDEIEDENVKRHIARFIRSVTSELEILRLREEIERQSSLSNAVQRFNQSLKNIDAEDTWQFLVQTSAEIMQAERGSLLMFDEAAQEFVVKAAVGSRADIIKGERKNLGGRVAQKVLQQGKPMIVKDIRRTEIQPAPAEWKYKTKSFISYPIIINGKKIGVLNVSDKIDGTAYDEFDLRLMNTFAPQLAVALDRNSLKRKAGEFELLSITDPLTGLLNRRYLEARLAEEIKRWERDGFPVSFMMIDVDDFKSYNDKFTHPEGDRALQLVGQALKVSLRGVDVAARYGGEEFSILLPQTTLGEAYTIAERIRERIEKTRFPNRRVTVSIGIATCSANLRTSETLIKAADEALYKAKAAGRNNVQRFTESETGE